MRSTDTDTSMTLKILLGDLISPNDLYNVSCLYKGMLDLRRASILKHTISSFLKKGIDYHSRVLTRIVEIRSLIKKEFDLDREGEPVFLVRVDEFPRRDIGSKKFLEFHKILSRKNVPYLLGVIPCPSKTYPSKSLFVPRSWNYGTIGEKDVEILKQLSNSTVEIAMHGITHQTKNTIRKTEIVGLNHKNLEKRLQKGLEKLQIEGFETELFIPPFNSFDLYSMESLRKYFKVVCGGPESVLYVDLRLSPCFLNGTLYVPSYYPAYGRAEEILRFVENVKKIKEFLFVPLTLHWTWEMSNNFVSVRKLCRVIQGRVVQWRSLYKRAHNFGSKAKLALV